MLGIDVAAPMKAENAYDSDFSKPRTRAKNRVRRLGDWASSSTTASPPPPAGTLSFGWRANRSSGILEASTAPTNTRTTPKTTWRGAGWTLLLPRKLRRKTNRTVSPTLRLTARPAHCKTIRCRTGCCLVSSSATGPRRTGWIVTMRPSSTTVVHTSGTVPFHYVVGNLIHPMRALPATSSSRSAAVVTLLDGWTILPASKRERWAVSGASTVRRSARREACVVAEKRR